MRRAVHRLCHGRCAARGAASSGIPSCRNYHHQKSRRGATVAKRGGSPITRSLVVQLCCLAADLGRRCGECSACCKLLAVDAVDLVKPAGQWCQHARPGCGGCAIYARRPLSCRAFACQWLVDGTFGPEWSPRRSRMVLRLEPAETGDLVLMVYIDPANPGAWRRPPYYRQLKDRATTGPVIIRIGRRRIELGPDGEEVELPSAP
jgi:hypothetical protein